MPEASVLHLADGGDVRDHVDAAAHAALVAYLERARPHAHSDIGSRLMAAGRALPGACTAFSPSFAGMRYVLLVRGRTPFALAFDMHSVALRLAGSAAEGARAWEPAPGWTTVDLWRPGVAEPDLRGLVLRAWEAAA
ncbi:MAG: hypothetical protein IT200_14145 [Thermoleophilia bacterium]|nr:hypothetical protein [Thermoleophilia bacterium]